MKTIIWTIGLLLLLTSCDYEWPYSYIVTNSTDTTIKVYVKTFDIDSIFIIKKDSIKTLFHLNHGIEGSKGPYFRDVNKDLNKFEIIKNDTIKSKRNYLKNDAWTFNDGRYSTTVTNDEFK